MDLTQKGVNMRTSSGYAEVIVVGHFVHTIDYRGYTRGKEFTEYFNTSKLLNNHSDP
jgi:hypothetical protein